MPVLLLILGIYGKGIVDAVGEYFWPPRAKLAILNLILYRTDFEKYPYCEFDLIVDETPRKNVTIELRQMTLFKNGIPYTFPNAIGRIDTGPDHPAYKRVVFQGEVIDLALKNPPDSSNLMVKLTYEYKNSGRLDSLVLLDRDLRKCTYWLNPFFENKTEAEQLNARVTKFGVVYKSHGGVDTFITSLVTDEHFLSHLNLLDMRNKLFGSAKLEYKINFEAFKRRYGGVYAGFIAEDTLTHRGEDTLTDLQIPRPKDIFCSMGDYELTDLFGMELREDYCSILDFDHFCFDPSREGDEFLIFEKNSHYYIQIIYENSENIIVALNYLRSLGYRVGSDSTLFIGLLLEALGKLAPPARFAEFGAYLNSRLDSLNICVHKGGFIVFFPFMLSEDSERPIIHDISNCLNKELVCVLRFDCKPYRSRFLAAGFADPIFVMTAFSDSTQRRQLDSLRLEQIEGIQDEILYVPSITGQSAFERNADKSPQR